MHNGANVYNNIHDNKKVSTLIALFHPHYISIFILIQDINVENCNLTAYYHHSRFDYTANLSLQ